MATCTQKIALEHDSGDARKNELAEIYQENIRLREEQGLLSRFKKDGNLLEKFDKPKDKLKLDKKCRKIMMKAMVLFLILCLLAAIVLIAYMKDVTGSTRSQESSASLLQPLPVGQPLLDDLQETEPLKKYYFNIGQRTDYLLQECQGPHLKRSFPDMDYALLGYNILKGYPLAIGHDPGFSLPIFAADYRVGSQTADCRYSVPKGIILIPDVSCITSFSSQVLETKYEFSKSLSANAHVSGGGWGVQFSASAGYKESSSVVATGESVFILSRASCNYYYMRLLEDDAPPFHPVFWKWILKLNNTNQDTVYVDFFERYGTHFLKEVKFGATFTYEHKMSSQDYKTEQEQGVNVAVSASYSGLFSVGGGFSMDSSQKEKASNFQKKVETRTITIGAAPPANGDALTWAATVQESPVPVSYELTSIEELFTETFMTGPKERMYSIDYKTISQNIINTKQKYCEVLKTKGLVDNCADLSPGLKLKDTQLVGGYFDKKILSSNGKCIDECYKKIDCVAVDFCVHCSKTEPEYNVCHMYNEIKTNRATKNEKYETTILGPEIEKHFELKDTAVIGNERSLNSNSSITTLRDCYSACLDDLFCVVFTYCTCPDKDKQCTLYAELDLFLTAEGGHTTQFISRHVKDVNSVYSTPTTTTRNSVYSTPTTTTNYSKMDNS